jgi:ABC-type nitrate/sulfonate/bicarbonate transport system substrate-binding protein
MLRAFALLVALLAATPATALDAIKVGITDRVNTVLPLWMAQAGSFYAAQGLAAEITPMGGGGPGIQALTAGRIDVMRVGLSSVAQGNRAGGDLRTIASMSNVIRFAFFTAPGVTTAAALKGGVDGISTRGSETDTVVTLTLRRLGLARADVTVKEFATARERLAALRAGEIRATVLNEPAASLAREQGVHVMLDLAAEQVPWLFSSVVVRRADLTARRDLLTRFLKAAIEGNYLAFTDPALAKDVLARELRLTDRKIVDISYEDFRKQSPLDMEPTRPAAENVLAEVPGGGRPEDHLDFGILDELRQQGFFAALRQKYAIR